MAFALVSLAVSTLLLARGLGLGPLNPDICTTPAPGHTL